MAPTDFIWNHERGQQSLTWSETPRLSVGLRVQVRRRVAGDDPRTNHNNDGKGVKRVEVAPAENFPGCPGGCLSAWSSVCVSGSWSCACLVFPGGALGLGLGCPLPLWLAASPVFLVSGSCAGCREKGRRPKNRSRRSFARAGPFQVSPACWQYWSVISRAYSYAGTYRGFFPSSQLLFFGGDRWKNLHFQSGLSVEVHVSFNVSLVSAFCFHCGVPCPTLLVCFLTALYF